MQPLSSPSLFRTDPSPTPREAQEPRRRDLWLAVHLPNLPLEALPGGTARAPTVVAEPVRGQWRVVAANGRARSLGIVPDLPLSSAFALAHALNVLPRSAPAERAVLEALAEWAYSITPLVGVETEASLALEVERSLKLFGGLDPIKALLAEELGRRRLTFHASAAPTVSAAVWLARQRQPDALTPESLPARLGALPIAATGWPPDLRTMLEDMGVRTIGDCLRLPRSGLARRIGRERVRELEQALGLEPTLRTERQPTQRFRDRVELDAETAASDVLVGAAAVLIDRLVPVLRRRQAEIATLSLELEHLHRASTSTVLDFVRPCHERERLLDLVTDRIERLTLPAPAIAVALETGDFRPLSIEPPALFGGGAETPRAIALLERLRERCGAAGVLGIAAAADHRPERAWTSPGRRGALRPGACDGIPSVERPLWLLPEPLPLDSPEARAQYRPPLALQRGPERIESGWWDDGDVGRDYFVATAARGERLWVFRDHRDGVWYLHGLFG